MAHGNSTRDIRVSRSQLYKGPFGRIFRNLPPLVRSDEDLKRLAETMVTDEERDNPTIPAGYTYFGQFIDHDITFDPTSSLARLNDPDKLNNFRTPALDLDCVYGSGPSTSPHLYDPRTQNLKLLVIPDAAGDGMDDLPRLRSPQDAPKPDLHRAVIADPRNDENFLVSQVQLAFIKFHNRIVDRLLTELGMTVDTLPTAEVAPLFATAQRMTRWHYQYVVLNDFLPRLVGEMVISKILPADRCTRKINTCFFNFKNTPFMPVEFSVAAYRLGHSMIRPLYHLNDTLTRIRRKDNGAVALFTREGKTDTLADLRGGYNMRQFWTLQWDRFLEFPDSSEPPQFSQPLDTKLARPLTDLPEFEKELDAMMKNLIFRNLVRGVKHELPSGQAVARAMGITPLDPTDVSEETTPAVLPEDPLWFYILKEAEVIGNGRKLGPVGAQIIAETFIGLLHGDKYSFLNVHPNWEPELPKFGMNFEFRDIVAFSGMAIRDPFAPGGGGSDGEGSTGIAARKTATKRTARKTKSSRTKKKSSKKKTAKKSASSSRKKRGGKKKTTTKKGSKKSKAKRPKK